MEKQKYDNVHKRKETYKNNYLGTNMEESVKINKEINQKKKNGIADRLGNSLRTTNHRRR
jgi:hypothetical protein